MEQRLLIAIILSLAVLIGYNSLFSPKTNEGFLQQKEEQYSQKQLAAEKPTIEKKAIYEEKKENLPPPSSLDEETQTIETEYVTAVFTNMGGFLKSLTINEYQHAIPVSSISNIPAHKNFPFNYEGFTNGTATYKFRNENLKIIKEYRFSSDGAIINARTEIKNISNSTISQNFNIENFVINTEHLNKKSDRSHARDNSLYEYSFNINNETLRTGNAFKFSQKNNFKKLGNINWSGFRDKYFCLLFKPEYASKGYGAEALSENKLSITSELEKNIVEPGESISFSSVIYVGPQDESKLKSYGLGFEKILAYSNFGILNMISMGMYRMMILLHRIIPNWGIVIILTGTLVYGAMYPLTLKGMGSMKKMQSLQPEMTKIKEQYKNNPQRLNKEIMGLYKEHSINPLGGCFPFLLQMPVFIGLYQVMWRAVFLKGSAFLWIKDLSQPDRLFIFPPNWPNFPFVGNELNILPLIMVVIMFFQQKLSAKNMATTDPNQLTQQRIMGIFFPVFLGFIFYKFASGLCLYFTVFYLFSTLTQWKMSKMTRVV